MRWEAPHEHYRREISERRVPAPRIVEAFDEGEHGQARLGLRLKAAALQQFAFERGERVASVALRPALWRTNSEIGNGGQTRRPQNRPPRRSQNLKIARLRPPLRKPTGV
jgi:hypothetical protein